MKRPPLSLLVLLLLRLLLLVPCAAGAQAAEGAEAAGALEGLNTLRRAQGLRALGWDQVLARTAGAYARELAQREALTHRDQAGGSVLERYRSHGGTATLVGEVLGAGAGLPEVAAAWASSPSHREVLLDARWTHAAAAMSALTDGRQLWVAVFARRLVEGLEIRLGPQGYSIEGRFAALAERATQPVLYSGIWLQPPEEWDRDRQRFRFVVPLDRGRLYHRLGYVVGDTLRLTDVFVPAVAATSAPETAPR